MKELEKFLRKGKLLSPGLYHDIQDLSQEEVESLLNSSSLVLSKRDLRQLKIPEPRIVGKEKRDKEHVHVSDFTNFYLERFKFLKDLIRGKLEDEEISSIGRLSSGRSSVIGMVRERKEGKVVVEDNTGHLILETEKDFLTDEVIGVKGEVIMDDKPRMSPNKVLYPDVPLRKSVNKTKEELKGLFLSGLGDGTPEIIKEKKPDYLFLASEIEGTPKSLPQLPTVAISKEKKVPEVKTDSDPVRVEVGGITVLLHRGDAVDKAKEELGLDQSEAMISLLKRRHLNPAKIHSLQDRYLLEEVPDIIHVSGEGVMANYKGVTLLSTSSDTAFLVNFGTREVEELEP